MAIVNVNEADFAATVAKGVVLVDFWATWCGPCRMQGAILEGKLAPARPDLTIAKVDVDQNMNLAQQYGIQSIPALRVFQDGKIIASFDGLTKTDELLAVLPPAASSSFSLS